VHIAITNCKQKENKHEKRSEIGSNYGDKIDIMRHSTTKQDQKRKTHDGKSHAATAFDGVICGAKPLCYVVLMLKKLIQNAPTLLQKFPLFGIIKKGWRPLSFCKENYIPFFREEKNYG
jgi:hypothetical protein